MIRIYPHSVWYSIGERSIMRRIADIVVGGDDEIFERRDLYRWQLGRANNWWAEVRERDWQITGEDLRLAVADAERIGVSDLSVVIHYRHGHKDEIVKPWLEEVFR